MLATEILDAVVEAIAQGTDGNTDGAYDADEIDLEANAVFAHVFVSVSATGSRVYH